MSTPQQPSRDWSAEAKGQLKSAMKLRGLSYAGLVKALAREGVEETEANLRNKVSRGNFSAAFFLQCMHVMGRNVIHLQDDLPDYLLNKDPEAQRKMALMLHSLINSGTPLIK